MRDRPANAACPICGKPADPRLRPFCSTRCADIDLGRWFTGQYRLAEPDPDEQAGPQEDEPEQG